MALETEICRSATPLPGIKNDSAAPRPAPKSKSIFILVAKTQTERGYFYLAYAENPYSERGLAPDPV